MSSNTAEAPEQRPVIADRVTVALIAKARADLALLKDRTGLSITDLVNRALILYAFIEAQMRAGKDLYVKDPETGETQLIRFL